MTRTASPGGEGERAEPATTADYKAKSMTLIELVRLVAPLPTQFSGDAFGFIHEDFFSNFAAQEGKGGGDCFTPTPSSECFSSLTLEVK